ncbi:hypothetical protein C8R48DRAFT_673988 [Suillus tomentosus]|nr:hypothetical protein C8R48DRAFT_673988 [Suillus tomentosus]
MSDHSFGDAPEMGAIFQYALPRAWEIMPSENWLCPDRAAETTAEKDRIRSAQALNIPDIDSAVLNLPPLSGQLAQGSSSDQCPSDRRAATIRALAKIAQENASMDQSSGEFDSHVPPDDFPMLNGPPIPLNGLPVPLNEPPIPPNEPPIPPNKPPIPPNKPPVPPNKPPIPPNALAGIAKLPKIKETMEYILALKNASLEDPIAKLGDDALERLRNPPKGPITIDSPEIRHSISMYLALEHASQAAYNQIMRSTTLNFAGADAFTGPFADLETCPMCDTSRWDQAKLRASNGHTKVAAQTFTTIPIGPQLQALYRHPDSAHDMRYLHSRVQEVLVGLAQTGEIPVFDDIAMGHDAIGAVLDGDIKENNIVLMVSLDGAQLYESKQSDCWMYIWVIINLSPDKRYRKVHVRPDGPRLIYWDGMVGHSRKNRCRVYCGVLGRHKPNGTHYYPALLKPLGQCATGSDHADISMFRLPPGGSQEYADNLRHLVSSPSQRQLEMHSIETGITKPPLILGLNPSHCLGVPNCMTTDIMHLAGNLSDLLMSLWHGTIDCAATDDVTMWDWAVLRDAEAWSAHGELVAQAEKLNTSYKTWEFQLYTFGLAPGLLHNVLPERYWRSYCKLVRGVQLMCQHSITIEHIREAQTLLCNWEYEFKLLYYRRRQDRIHFIRPCVHQTNHLVADTIRKGPPICYAQWTMERTIGNLGQEICQPSRPYANLSQEGLPIAAIDSGDGFALLRKCDRYAFSPVGGAAQAILDYLGDGSALPRIKRWARLLLPNGQIAWSVWRETLKPLDQTRTSRNVKIKYHGEVRFGEVLYFTRLLVEAGLDEDRDWRWHDVALIQMYSHPDDDLLQLSSHTVTSCSCLEDICVISIKQILSVVAMIPRKPILPCGVMDAEGRFFMLEKPGLDLSSVGIANVPPDDEDNVPDIE